MKKFIAAVAMTILGTCAVSANASTLYSTNFGSLVPGYYQNDDNFYGPQNLGFSLNFFGNTYSSFYISNNGNVTFGAGTWSYSPTALNVQNTAAMIAPYWTDLYTAGGAPDAGVYLLQSAGKNIITWNNMGYFPTNYTGTATFQLVLNDPNNIPVGEGSIGFFYDRMSSGTDYHSAAAGFGDGLSTINPGEISVASGSTAALSAELTGTHIWFNVNNGAPVQTTPDAVPEPSTVILMGVGLAGIAGFGFHRRKQNRA